MHEFTVAQGFNDITILFCRKCGKSYSLISYNQVLTRTVWEEMEFERFDGTAATQPPMSCEDLAAKGELQQLVAATYYAGKKEDEHAQNQPE